MEKLIEEREEQLSKVVQNVEVEFDSLLGSVKPKKIKPNPLNEIDP